MSAFSESIDEFHKINFQTKPLEKHSIDRLHPVLCAIAIDYINFKDWNLFLPDGSITFQKNTDERDKHKVIKIFIDYQNKLAEKLSIIIPEKEPVVVGIELTHEDPFVRKQIRDWLRKTFKDHYADPASYPKVSLMPHPEHFYDILFLRNGECEYSENEIISETISQILENFNSLEK